MVCSIATKFFNEINLLSWKFYSFSTWDCWKKRSWFANFGSINLRNRALSGLKGRLSILSSMYSNDGETHDALFKKRLFSTKESSFLDLKIIYSNYFQIFPNEAPSLIVFRQVPAISVVLVYDVPFYKIKKQLFYSLRMNTITETLIQEPSR